MWSLGVLMYLMLSGRAPFNDEDEVEIMRLITIGHYEMKGKVWNNISS